MYSPSRSYSQQAAAADRLFQGAATLHQVQNRWRLKQRIQTRWQPRQQRHINCRAALIGPMHLASKLKPAWQGLLACLCFIAQVLREPPGGHPTGVITWLPGWHISIARGPRRWLGLVPGRRQPVSVPGAWYTPSGLLNNLRRLPTALWLMLIAYLVFKLVLFIKWQRVERDKFIQEKTLIAAAKFSDLKVQKNRMLRALGGSSQAQQIDDVLVLDTAEVEWQDPTEWQPATWQQWEDFMQKSRALQLRKDKWWDIDTVDDVPYHKKAHDNLTISGQLPDYSS